MWWLAEASHNDRSWVEFFVLAPNISTSHNMAQDTFLFTSESVGEGHPGGFLVLVVAPSHSCPNPPVNFDPLKRSHTFGALWIVLTVHTHEWSLLCKLMDFLSLHPLPRGPL